jgi:hypothetical protein
VKRTSIEEDEWLAKQAEKQTEKQVEKQNIANDISDHEQEAYG